MTCWRKPTLAGFTIGLLAILLALPATRGLTATADALTGNEVCDTSADHPLLTENYPEAAKLHRRLVALHPEDALAHYHLGFAYGMLGNHAEELAEYRKAADLGLERWDLFVNLGLADFEAGNLEATTAALSKAVALGPNRPETHFNLGLVYERRGMLPQAEREMETSLRLDPDQPDARNMLGVIYAERRDFPRARQVWSELARKYPDFEPARANLSILDWMGATANTQIPFRDASPSSAMASSGDTR